MSFTADISLVNKICTVYIMLPEDRSNNIGMALYNVGSDGPVLHRSRKTYYYDRYII